MAIQLTARTPDSARNQKRHDRLAARQGILAQQLKAAQDQAEQDSIQKAREAAEQNLAAIEKEAEERRAELQAQQEEQQKIIDQQRQDDDEAAKAARAEAAQAKQLLEEEAEKQQEATAQKLAAAQQKLDELDQQEELRKQTLAQQEDQLKALEDAKQQEEDLLASRIAEATKAVADAGTAGADAVEALKYNSYLQLAALLNITFGEADDGSKSADTFLDQRLVNVSLAHEVRQDEEDPSKPAIGVQADSKYYEMTDNTVNMLSDEKLTAKEAYMAIAISRTGANFANYPVHIYDDALDQDIATYNKYMLYLIAKDTNSFAIENEDELQSLARYAKTKGIAAQAKKDFETFKTTDFYQGTESTADPVKLQSDLENTKSKMMAAFNKSASGVAPAEPPSNDADDDLDGDDDDNDDDNDGPDDGNDGPDGNGGPPQPK